MHGYVMYSLHMEKSCSENKATLANIKINLWHLSNDQITTNKKNILDYLYMYIHIQFSNSNELFLQMAEASMVFKDSCKTLRIIK